MFQLKWMLIFNSAQMSNSVKISIARIILIQLISVIGILVYDWALFEMVVVYLTESVVLYFVFNLNHYFIHPHTRYHPVFAFILLSFSVVLFSGLLLGYSIAAFYITQDVDENNREIIQAVFVPKMQSMNVPYIFMVLLVLELIIYYIRIAKDRKNIENSFWTVMNRLLFSHLFIAAGLALLVLFNGYHYLVVTLFIAFKVILELFTMERRLLNNIRHSLMVRARFRRLKKNNS